MVCEKPLAMSAAESRELVELAARTGLVNAANFNIRYYPLNQHAHEVVTSGDLGDVRLVTGRYFQDWLLLDSDWNWRLQPERGGALRAVGDIGSHWLDLMTFVTGQRVDRGHGGAGDVHRAAPRADRPGRDVLDRGGHGDRHAATSRPRTRRRSCCASRTARAARSASARSAPGRKNSLQYEIDGSESSVAWDSEQPDQIWFGHRDRANEILIKNPALMGEAGRAAAALPGGHVEGFGDTFAAHFRAVYADVAAGGPSARPTYPTFADGHDEMLVNDAIAESARVGRWVDVVRDPVPVASAGAEAAAR